MVSVWLKLFAKSPFKPLIKHSQIVVKSVEVLEQAMEAWNKGQVQEMEKLCSEVDELEKEADRIKESIRNTLTSKVFMPVSRADVLLYLYFQDKVADAAQDVAKWLIVCKGRDVPDALKDKVIKIGKESIAVAKRLHEAISQLDMVIESGFREEEIQKEYELIREVEEIEHSIDVMSGEIMQFVFDNEDKLSYGDALFILGMSRCLTAISDKAKDAVERIRQMLAHS
ncbi:MAG: TIGR00153 family protein [Candidatus Hydrothermota bacterium]|nr:MAG: TIGR00153 family protein [Candidatus Hydrothermae bacterium]